MISCGIEYVNVLQMGTQFYITFSFKTNEDYKAFAKFFIGNNREIAYAIFKKLNGSDDVSI